MSYLLGIDLGKSWIGRPTCEKTSRITSIQAL